MEPVMKKRPVDTYEVEAMCPNCPEGRVLKAKGFMYPTLPPMYPHACLTCGYTVNLSFRYPRIEYI